MQLKTDPIPLRLHSNSTSITLRSFRSRQTAANDFYAQSDFSNSDLSAPLFHWLNYYTRFDWFRQKIISYKNIPAYKLKFAKVDNDGMHTENVIVTALERDRVYVCD